MGAVHDESDREGELRSSTWLAFFDEALPHVYGYLSSRCSHDRATAEDLTTEAFLALLESAGRTGPEEMSIGYAIGVARHKLVDHWRRQARTERRFELLATRHEAERNEADDPAEVTLDALAAREALAALAAQHQAVLTLRYVDDLPVAEVAALLGRSVHATEALLTRAKAAFRTAYGPQEMKERPDG